MPSIKQLARRLDVSIGTVSRALNDRPGVAPETRAMVLRIAEEIGYVANASGRSLRSGITNTVGLVIEADSPAALECSNFFVLLADAMLSVMGPRGYDLVLLPCRRAADPVGFLQRLVRRGTVDAVVISATRVHDPRIDFLLGSGLPFLCLGRSETPGDYAWIDLDFEGMARASAERLVALGHRRIAVVVADDGINLGQVYRRAALAALERHGLAADATPVLVEAANEAGGVAALRRILTTPNRPSAVMICAEVMLPGLYEGLARAGLQAGRDLSVIGSRASPLLRHLVPPPSAFSLDFEGLGVAIAEAATDLAARRTPTSVQMLWPVTLYETTSIRPGPSP